MRRVFVTVFGGNVISFTDSEIKEMLADKEMFRDADNLPKWLFVAGVLDKSHGFPRTWKQVWKLIEMIDKHTGTVRINIRSDDRFSHSIAFIKHPLDKVIETMEESNG